MSNGMRSVPPDPKMSASWSALLSR